MKFKEFLQNKGISDETFATKSASEMASLHNEFTAELIKSIEDKTATKEELSSLKTELDNSTQVKELIDKIEATEQSVQALKENGGVDTEKSELIKFIEGRTEQKFSANRTREAVEVKAAALMTTANVIPNVASGFNQLFGNYIDPTIHHAPKQDTFIMDLVDTQVAPGTENIWYVETQNEEGDAEFIAEGSLKPLIDREYIEKKADIKEVAERWKMSKRLIQHAPSVVSDFRSHADDLISLKMDSGVLMGDGTGNNLNGIVSLASPFIVPSALANAYASANIWDCIQAIATYVRLNNFKGALTCTLNTVWKAKMSSYKDANNNYIIPPFVSKDGTSVGEVMVKFENGFPEAGILVGELKRFKVRISENVTYHEGFENDDFSKNLESRKLEAFLGTYLPTNYSGAIIYDDIATVLTAIQSA